MSEIVKDLSKASRSELYAEGTMLLAKAGFYPDGVQFCANEEQLRQRNAQINLENGLQLVSNSVLDKIISGPTY
jgi:hypothetical protein